MSTDEKMSKKQKIPVVHLKRFSLAKIFAYKIFTSQKFSKMTKTTWGKQFLPEMSFVYPKFTT